MYCKNCGKQIEDGKEYCSECESKEELFTEVSPIIEEKTNSNNGNEKTDTNANNNTTNNMNYNVSPSQKSKITAGLFGIFLGQFGVHNFYLGYTSKATVQLVVSCVGLLLSCCTSGIGSILNTAMGIWGLIEGILILTGSINTDGEGKPLKD